MKITKLILRIFLILAAFATLASCATSPYMQVMYIREGVLQYYISTADSVSAPYTLSVDITFRDDPKLEEPAIINFTLQCRNDDPFVPVSFAFKTAQGSLVDASKPVVIYIDRSRNLVRMTSKMRHDSFVRVLDDHASDVVVGFANAAAISFKLNERTVRELNLLQGELIP